MRIVAGSFKGLKLASAGIPNSSRELRPTSVRTRVRTFDLLTHGRHGNRVSGARVLDLFAGTGALGIEALSRGASYACFVDISLKACRVIRDNLELAGVEDRTLLLRKDATRLGCWRDRPFDLIFSDPPYGRKLSETALRDITGSGWLSHDCMIVAEDTQVTQAPFGLMELDHRRFGGTLVTLIARQMS